MQYTDETYFTLIQCGLDWIVVILNKETLFAQVQEVINYLKNENRNF